MKSNRDSRSNASPSDGNRKARARDLLNQGLASHQVGRLAEAERFYKRAVKEDERLADGHHLLGLTLHQQGRSAEGLRSIELALGWAPQAANFHLSYGAALASLGHLRPAAGAFRRVLAARPADEIAFRNLAAAELGVDQPERAAAAAGRACTLDRTDTTAWTARAHAARRLGRRDEAADACRAALALEPDFDEARFLLASLEGDPQRSPPSYVRQVFDKYAGHFDRDLVERLGYRTPEMLAALAAKHLAPAPKSLSVLDLGCGTGLAGVALASLARRLVGVDLSPAMLAEAKKRGLYADLIEGDLESMAFAQPFDLAVAADVLIYLGDLSPTFAAIDRALSPGGAILFSVEELEKGGTFQLTDDLRYAHAYEHIRTLASAQGWSEVASERAALRRQGGKPVAGILFLFRKS